LDFDGIMFNVPAGGTFNYSILEPLKDGMLFNSKYESGELIFNSPHVIIFSNEKPDFNNKYVNKMDKNRWRIYKYKADKEEFKLLRLQLSSS